jgi:hypothetical protein
MRGASPDAVWEKFVEEAPLMSGLEKLYAAFVCPLKFPKYFQMLPPSLGQALLFFLGGETAN